MRIICKTMTRIIGETMRGSVTRNMVRMFEPPATREASSSAASMLRKAGVSSITLPAMPLATMCAHRMPGML